MEVEEMEKYAEAAFQFFKSEGGAGREGVFTKIS